MRFMLSFIMALAGLAIIIFIYYHQQGRIPSSYIPWKPLDLNEAPGLFTSYKINKLQSAFEQCQSVLANSEIEYSVIGERTAGACELSNQISLKKSDYPYSAPVQGRCALVAALAGWEKQAVQPLAEQFFDSDIASITHYGTFSCRNVAGSSRRSEHASANAIDIAAFTLDNGQRISVLSHWNNEGPKGQFLQALHKESCCYFNTVLGPDYNEAHANHFHMDMGRYSICR